MNPRVLNRDFQHPADGWYQIEALGNHPNPAAGVLQVISADAARAIAVRFNADAAAGRLHHGSEMLIDHEHFSDQPDQETRAYGWLQELQGRADGLYGRIRWTATGKAAVDGGDYRFFSTEYDPQDMEPAAKEEVRSKNEETKPLRPLRPLRLSGLTVTNMNNNRGQKPITNRSGAGVPARPTQTETHGQDAHATNFASAPAPADSKQPTTQNKKMKSVCTLLGLSADADEVAVHTAVSKLLNRGDITADALAGLRAENRSLTGLNQTLLGDQSDSLLDGCGVKDEPVRSRLKEGLNLLKNRHERLSYLADFGYAPGKAGGQDARATGRVLNRGAAAAREVMPAATAEGEQALAIKIQNRANELKGAAPRRPFDNCWQQARQEVLQNK